MVLGGGGVVPNTGGCLSDARVSNIQKQGQESLDPDKVNPDYIDNIVIASDGTVTFTLRLGLAGDTAAADVQAQIIQDAYGRKDVNIVFALTQNLAEADLVIAAVPPEAFIEQGIVCSCESALKIGGRGPFTGNMLYMNSAISPNDRLSGPHEMAHKFGLRHRNDGGITSTGDMIGPIRNSDVDRIRRLYDPASYLP